MIKLFVIIDGLGDKAVKKFNYKTPLELADIPNLNYFAKEGATGLVYTISKKIAPESDEALWSLLGNKTKEYVGRGPLEAVGSGIKFNDGDLVLRANFATEKDKKIIDRRVGRTLTTKEAKKLARAVNKNVKLSHPFTFYPTIAHRGILVIKGNLSAKISNTDPAYKKIGNLANAESKETYVQKLCKPIDKTLISKQTADLVNEFVKQSSVILDNHRINKRREHKNLLKANLILLRDAGNKVPVKTAEYSSWASIVGMPLEKAITSLHGMKVLPYNIIENKKADYYSTLYLTLKNAIKEAKKQISKMEYPSYFVHFKETDIPGHDGRFIDKKQMLELIDREFFSFVRKIKYIQLIVTGDHSTPCALKSHSSDPVPLLWYGFKKDSVEKFSERDCKKGSLGILYGNEVMKKLNFK